MIARELYLGQVVLLVLFIFSVNKSSDTAQIIQRFSPMLSTGRAGAPRSVQASHGISRQQPALT
jgi:hypothetical protein